MWVPEGGGRDALSLLAAFAGATRRASLATGILPIFSRTPAVTAMSAAGMAAISSNRFILGLGTGHGPVVAGTHGIPYSAPLARMEETVAIVRGLLAGESVDSDGRHFTVAGARLGRAARGASVPLYVAALGPRMIELAGRAADGVLLNWTAAGHIAGSVGDLRASAARAGRDPGSVDAAGYVRTAVTEGADEERIRRHLRLQVAGYAAHRHYRSFFASTGFGRGDGRGPRRARRRRPGGGRGRRVAAHAGPGGRGRHGRRVPGRDRAQASAGPGPAGPGRRSRWTTTSGAHIFG